MDVVKDLCEVLSEDQLLFIQTVQTSFEGIMEEAKIISSLSVSKIIFLFFSLAYNTVDITISSKTLTILQFTKFNLSESLFTFVISITLFTNLNNLYEFCFNMFKYKRVCCK